MNYRFALATAFTAASLAVVLLASPGCNTGSSNNAAVNSSTTQPPDDHANGINGATVIGVIPSQVGGVIDYAGDEDYFVVTLQANTNYTFRTQSTGDTFMTLVGPSGTPPALASNDNEGSPTNQFGSSFTFMPTVAGPHYVIVSQGPAAPGPPPYTLQVQ